MNLDVDALNENVLIYSQHGYYYDLSMSDLRGVLNRILLNLVTLWVFRLAGSRANKFARRCRFGGRAISGTFDKDFMSEVSLRLLPKLSPKVGQFIINFVTIYRIIKLAAYGQPP